VRVRVRTRTLAAPCSAGVRLPAGARTPLVYGLIASSLAAAAAIAALVAALVIEAPPRDSSGAGLCAAVATMLLGGAAGVALRHHGELALTAWSIATGGASWCIWSVRARHSGGGGDDGWGGGGGGGPGDPPEDPRGPSPDWERFERDFRAYVEARSAARC